MKKKCDFCGDDLRSVFWEHPCDDFEMEILAIVGDNIVNETTDVSGAWLACIPCHMMVEDAIALQNKGQDTTEIVAQMANRCRARYIRRNPQLAAQPREAFFAAAVETINAYLEHRVGQPVRRGGQPLSTDD